ncbi:nucleotidyltransferase [Microvirga sp. G4-2]|uniref:nucleotidyltransferase n=1 Tax=Microvirga sp. G4-2 TaxID=3434467 RepID=UPI004043CFD6
MTSPDNYLRSILAREAIATGLYTPANIFRAELLPVLREWAGIYLVDAMPSGSFAKGTANRSGTDIDIFISLHHETPGTLRELYNNFFVFLHRKGFKPRRQNVSLGITVGGFDVDLVPARRWAQVSEDHSLYRRKADTWIKTNVARHIAIVSGSGCQDEIRLLKLWRDQRKLDFPSLYLELTVIEALGSVYDNTLCQNIVTCLTYLSEQFANARVLDPSNTNNVLSDEISMTDKARVQITARRSLAGAWEDLVR